MSSDTNINVEQLGVGVTKELLHNGRIVVFNVSDSSRAAANAWYHGVLNAARQWPTRYRWLAMHDFLQGHNLGLSPYVRKLAESIYKDPVWKAMKGTHVALVLPPTVFRQLVALLVRSQAPRFMETRLFDTRESALAWLAKLVEK